MRGWAPATGSILVILGAVIAILYALTVAMPDAQPDAAAQAPTPEPEPAGLPGAEEDSGANPREPVARRLEGEFARIADQYEAGSRFPPYSFPIDDDAVGDYRYNRYSPVNVPVAVGDARATITIELARLHFEHGEPITGQVRVSGDGASELALDEATLRDQAGGVLHREPMEAGNGEEALSVSPSAGEAAEWPMELMLMVSGEFRGETVDAVAPVRYHPAVGEITSVGASRVEGAHLLIPVEVDVDSDGDYAIAGNLYSESGTALAHLEHEARLSSMDGSATLRVHRQALEASGDEGPYELGNLSLRQLPARPGDQTRFAPESDQRHRVEGAAFERYSPEDYQDPMREARLEFLRNAVQEGEL